MLLEDLDLFHGPRRYRRRRRSLTSPRHVLGVPSIESEYRYLDSALCMALSSVYLCPKAYSLATDLMVALFVC